MQKLQQQAFRCKTIICLHRCQCISTYIRYFGENLLQFWIWKAEQIEAADKSLGGSPVTQKSQLSRVHSRGSRAKTQRPQHKNDGNLFFWNISNFAAFVHFLFWCLFFSAMRQVNDEKTQCIRNFSFFCQLLVLEGGRVGEGLQNSFYLPYILIRKVKIPKKRRRGGQF